MKPFTYRPFKRGEEGERKALANANFNKLKSKTDLITIGPFFHKKSIHLFKDNLISKNPYYRSCFSKSWTQTFAGIVMQKKKKKKKKKCFGLRYIIFILTVQRR
ncbi:unnamed protein product [Natator depressus]